MRSAPVVVRDVLGEDSSRGDAWRARAGGRGSPRGRCAPSVRRTRSRSGQRTGVRIVSAPIEAKTSSKLAVNLVSRSRTRKRIRRPASSRSGAEVAGHLGHPGAVGVGGDAEEVDDAAFDFDHEQHVVAAQQHGVDGEEVGGHDALGLGAEELGPGRTSSPWRGRKPMASQDVGDAALGDRDAELLQLARRCAGSPSGGSPGRGGRSARRSRRAGQAALVVGAGRSSAVGRAPGASAGSSRG